MLVAIHQPHYLPWLGYLSRMACADLFVLLDHVQFERGNYQNRTRIRMNDGTNGAARWLTVPVEQRSREETIAGKRIDNALAGPRHWSRVHLLTLRHAYREARHLGACLPALEEIYARPFERLVDLDAALLEFLRRSLAIRTPLVRSSTLGARGAKSELVLDICRRVGARALLVGLGASRAYLDRAAFARAGIALVSQRFAHPQYRQCGAPPFIAGLSAIDLVLNCGADARRTLDAAAATEERLAA
ncbi:MAG TPA: WbqC family protein [Burkholderiales bacterium]|nr:WbqC family protein [Burkholderiales bacterium]